MSEPAGLEYGEPNYIILKFYMTNIDNKQI